MNNINNSNTLVKQQRLTKAERLQFSLTAELTGILVGLLLGDLYMEKRFLNVRCSFVQGLVHQDYLMHLYEIFQIYCTAVPRIPNTVPDKSFKI